MFASTTAGYGTECCVKKRFASFYNCLEGTKHIRVQSVGQEHIHDEPCSLMAALVAD